MTTSLLQPVAPPTFFNFREGTSPREIEAHLMARAFLSARLDDDLRVQHLCENFGGLWEKARELADFSDAFARECGWMNRAHMHGEPDLHDPTQSPRCAEWEGRVHGFPWDLPAFHREAEALVYKTWRLPREHAVERWSWLADDLTRSFGMKLLSLLQGRRMAIDYGLHVSHETLEAFAPRSNETPDETRRRLKQWYLDSDATLAKGAETPATPNDPSLIGRDVGWFYRNVLKQPADKFYALSREYVQAAREHKRHLAPDQRGTVKAGIARARRWLSEIPA